MSLVHARNSGSTPSPVDSNLILILSNASVGFRTDGAGARGTVFPSPYAKSDEVETSLRPKRLETDGSLRRRGEGCRALADIRSPAWNGGNV
jgi:hypothetical protein